MTVSWSSPAFGCAVLLAATFACSASPASSQPAASIQDYFPLRKGSYWIYSAEVDWTVLNSNGEVRHSRVRLKSEVIDVVTRENVFAARVRGFVQDLGWYEPNRPPGDYVIVRVGVNHYYLLGNDTPELWKKISELPPDSRLQELGYDDLLLEVPLTRGALFGDPVQTPRAWYCWEVADEQPVHLPTRVCKRAGVHEFTLKFRTTPDFSEFGFVPGVGITRFRYAHHGTVANCNARLIEFHRGS